MTKQLITLTDPRSSAAEAYRSLYINLSFSSQEQPLHTLLATSAGAGEGKSLTLANLAVVAVQLGQRVVLLDCDLRQPQQWPAKRRHRLHCRPSSTCRACKC